MVKPRIESLPKSRTSKLGDQAVELYAEVAGRRLDDWQEIPLRASLADPLPMKVGVTLPRQNGKSEIIIARMLAGVFLLEREMQIYTAHKFSTAMEMFRRFTWILEESSYAREIATNDRGRPKIIRSHGEEGIEFVGNRRVYFRTRSGGGGRGFSSDDMYFDEAMEINETEHDALVYTTSARPSQQIWYVGSAVDQERDQHGLVFARIRERAKKGDDPALAYFEWSAPYEHPNKIPETLLDWEIIRQANPTLDIRIRRETIEDEARGSLRSLATERYGVGDWPNPEAIAGTMIRLEDWRALEDRHSTMEDPLDALAFDVSPDRRASIAAVGANLQELWHLEIIDNREGTSWLPTRVAELVERHRPRVVVCAGHSPATAFIQELSDLGVDVQELSVDEHAQACGRLVDAVEEKRIRHPGGSVLAGAIRGAKSRPLGDAWLWSRRYSDVDISPLVAVTLALSAAIEGREASVYDTRGVLAV